MILTQTCNILLLPGVILCSNDLIHPPFVAGCSGKHTTHKMIGSIRMVKGMQCIILIHTKFL